MISNHYLVQVNETHIIIEELNDESHLVNDLGMDSITLIALMFLCEERFVIDVASEVKKTMEIETTSETICFLNEQKVRKAYKK